MAAVRNASTNLLLACSLAIAAGAGCGPPLGTLTEGVSVSRYSEASDLTKLESSDSYVYDTSDFYVQAVVNNVLATDHVTATLLGGGSLTLTFTAAKDGDVGIGFHFQKPAGVNWKKGSAMVTVKHEMRAVGTASFTVQ